MSYSGYQLIKTNADAQAVTINASGHVIFGATNLSPIVDSNISYNATTGVFTFTDAGLYYVSWFVNAQTNTAADLEFSLEVSDGGAPPTTVEYPAASIFKTGELSGTALISVVAGGTVALFNSTSGVATLAIGSGMVTAGITFLALSGVGGRAAQVYLDGTLLGNTTIAANGIFPFDVPPANQTSGGILINTTTSKGTVTITAAGIYLVDWWAAIAAATAAKEITLQIIDGSSTILASSYHVVTTSTHVSGFAVVTVSEAQASAPGGYTFGLYNRTVRTTGAPVALNLSSTTYNAALRVSVSQ